VDDLTVPICVVGAGTMGAGIAQVAVAAGHPVSLVDLDADQLASARDGIVARLAKRDADATDKVDRQLSLHTELSKTPVHPNTVVIEAVLEDLGVKQSVFRQAVAHFGPSCILATNTSSLSVTAIAAGVPDPTRTVGMHFFNPVPVMKLVEVVWGLQTDDAVANMIIELAERWGKAVVRVKSTPGFIVNRVARGFYGEALRLLEEGAAPPETIDEVVRASGGFRMGPFELMDLIGNDVNFAVTRTVWSASNFDPRFAPSHWQGELVAAGRLGRKTGQGFYDYRVGATRSTPATLIPPDSHVEPTLVLHGECSQLESFLKRTGAEFARNGSDGTPSRLELVGHGWVVMSRGLTAAEESRQLGAPTVVVDRCLDPARASAVAVASPSMAPVQMVARLLARGGVQTHLVTDLPGLLLARILVVIANEAWETAHHGVATPADIDLAMRLGTNYPLGPFEWSALWSPGLVVTLLDALWAAYHDPRYRASQALRAATV
jgi:3-hydroxybutyryl-CoA dehydrogenase